MNTRARTVTPDTLAALDHHWMTRAACARRTDLPWTEDAHRVSDGPRAAMAQLCRTCPVRGCCRHYAKESHASAGFWAGSFRDGVDAPDLLRLLTELDDEPVGAGYGQGTDRDRQPQRKAVAT
ncbi:WhiB family transcriptional regulator [Aquipuribacter sp. MA13-6]|uniref:WhiB family transcriptional regulator n=1 Tax=unclassified Aquipuribacter TaxID=2635084 RepID=UPI003EEFFF0D